MNGLMKITVYEVGPRDGLQYIKHFVPTSDKQKLIGLLYDSGLTEIEEVSFAHPKILPQMADAEEVWTGIGAGLVMNQRGFDRAMDLGMDYINIVFSPCETFNLKNMGKTRSEIVLMYKTMLNAYPKDLVRVYISMAFGSPYSGSFSESEIKSCIRDAKMLGSTVVLSDTVGAATEQEVKDWASIVYEEDLTPALHLHHKGSEEQAIRLVRAGLFSGIRQFDSSIGGLGGCPFAEGSGANLDTALLVSHLHAWGFETGVDEKMLGKATDFAKSINTFFSGLAIPTS